MQAAKSCESLKLITAHWLRFFSGHTHTSMLILLLVMSVTGQFVDKPTHGLSNSQMGLRLWKRFFTRQL